MSLIQLDFYSAKRPELHRVSVSHPVLKEPSCSVRGRFGGACPGAASFQWTAGVKALSLLLVRSALSNAECGSQAVLRGDLGSPAAALDSTLGKRPVWLIEMFGSDKSGRPLARRMFSRTNANRKRPGPVEVSLNAAFWSPLRIRVALDGIELAGVRALLQLAEELERHFVLRTPNAPAGKAHCRAAGDSPLSEQSLISRLKQAMIDEIHHSIHTTEIFNRTRLLQTVRRVSENESFQRVAGGKPPIISEIDLSLSPSNRLGLMSEKPRLDRLLRPERPVVVRCPSPIASSLVLFLFLRDVRGYRLELDFSDAHSVETARTALQREYADPPDFCVFAVAPAASVLAAGPECEYEPVMLLPRLSQGIVGPQGSRAATGSGSYEFMFVGDNPSISSFLYDELLRSGYVDKHSSTTHLENDEAFAALMSADPNSRAIMFFPFYFFNQWVNNCELFADPRTRPDMQEAVLFAHRSVTSSPSLLRCFDIAVRDAWLELKCNPALVIRLVERLLAEPGYLMTLGRHAGLFNAGAAGALNHSAGQSGCLE